MEHSAYNSGFQPEVKATLWVDVDGRRKVLKYSNNHEYLDSTTANRYTQAISMIHGILNDKLKERGIKRTPCIIF